MKFYDLGNKMYVYVPTSKSLQVSHDKAIGPFMTKQEIRDHIRETHYGDKPDAKLIEDYFGAVYVLMDENDSNMIWLILEVVRD